MLLNASFPFSRISRLTVLSGMLMVRAFAADPAPTDAQARFEVDFITELIDHDQAALAMAQLVTDRSQRPELRAIAADQVAAETAEIKTLQGWLKDWYGETYEPELGRRSERLVTTLTGLQRDAFEQAFLRALSLHHAKTLELAGRGLLRAAHSKLIDQVRETVAVQADEIALMRGWLLKWYNINEVTAADLPDNRRWDTQGPILPSTTTTTPATTSGATMSGTTISGTTAGTTATTTTPTTVSGAATTTTTPTTTTTALPTTTSTATPATAPVTVTSPSGS